MDFSVALVFTVGGLITAIVTTQLWQMNYFKRENFKFGQQMKRKEYNIKFKKLERDLKLKETAPVKEEKGLIELLKDVNPETIKTLLGAVNNKEDDLDFEEPDEKPDVFESILSYAKENPEMVNNLLKQVTNKTEGGGDEFKTQD